MRVAFWGEWSAGRNKRILFKDDKRKAGTEARGKAEAHLFEDDKKSRNIRGEETLKDKG